MQRNPKQKVSPWTIIKDMIGKDITRISVPGKHIFNYIILVYFNEPIGLLQKIGECFENAHLLDKAANEKNPYLRLAYISAFNASNYNACYGEKLKPFNPMLGETFEFVNDQYRLICEQVSHHPPISTCHCESKNYAIFFNTQVTNRFWGNSLEFKPIGKTHLELKTLNETYIFNRPNTLAQNIIFGHLYLDLGGESITENTNTGDKCIIKFKPRGWKVSNLGLLEGFVINKAGEKMMEVKGKWCESIWAIDLKTGDKIMVWEKFPLPKDWENIYCFTHHSLQLNHLTEKLKKLLPPTDSRLRPDQRAYENGDIKLAISEKNRLEEKQRATRKIMEQKKIPHKAAYFSPFIDPITKEQSYCFNGKYWKDRESGNWGHLPDIFGK